MDGDVAGPRNFLRRPMVEPRRKPRSTMVQPHGQRGWTMVDRDFFLGTTNGEQCKNFHSSVWVAEEENESAQWSAAKVPRVDHGGMRKILHHGHASVVFSPR